MPKPILMPQVGQDLTEGKLIELHVKVGDRVSKNDVVAVVESEKASFEVEAFEEGTVLQILYNEGDTTTVLEPLMLVGDPGEVVADDVRTSTGAHPLEVAPEEAQADRRLSADANLVGSSRLRVSPVARRIAAQNGIDLSAVSGSGPKHSIVKRDLDDLLKKRSTESDAFARQTSPVGHRDQLSAQEVRGSAGPLYFAQLRDGDAPPIVLIHGFGADLNAWRTLLAHLPADRAAIALDLPSHGNSVGVNAGGFEAVVASVLDTLQGAGLASIHLVGHSLGAAVAVSAADAGVLDVRSLTLLAPAGLTRTINGAFFHGYCAARSENELAVWLSLLVENEALVQGALLRATARARQDDALVAAQARLATALFPGGTQRFTIHAALDRIAVPVRAIVGMSDTIVPPAGADTLPPHVAQHRLQGIGHLPQLEAPKIVGTAIAQAIRSAG